MRSIEMYTENSSVTDLLILKNYIISLEHGKSSNGEDGLEFYSKLLASSFIFASYRRFTVSPT